MRFLLTILTTFIVVQSYCQQNSITATADTFRFSQKFIWKELVLRSDSTFYERSRSCTQGDLETGYWTKQCDSIILTHFYKIPVRVTTALAAPSRTTPFITFRVQDINGNPLSDYLLVFGRNNCCDTGIYTDQDGYALVSREYRQFYAESDQSDDWSKITRRFIKKDAASVTVILGLKQPAHDSVGEASIRTEKTLYIQDAGLATKEKRVFYKKKKQQLLTGNSL